VICFPTEAELVEAISRGLRDMGETVVARDPSAFSAALARGRNAWEYAGQSDILALAIAVGISIFRNRHPLYDGNKRAGYIAIQLVLLLNDHFIDTDRGPDEIAELVRAAAAGELDESTPVEALRPFVVHGIALDD